MDDVRQHRLARPGLAHEQYGGRAARDLSDEIQDGTHLGAAPDHLGGAVGPIGYSGMTAADLFVDAQDVSRKVVHRSSRAARTRREPGVHAWWVA
jgi:hypothetical protein